MRAYSFLRVNHEPHRPTRTIVIVAVRQCKCLAGKSIRLQRLRQPATEGSAPRATRRPRKQSEPASRDRRAKRRPAAIARGCRGMLKNRYFIVRPPTPARSVPHHPRCQRESDSVRQAIGPSRSSGIVRSRKALPGSAPLETLGDRSDIQRGSSSFQKAGRATKDDRPGDHPIRTSERLRDPPVDRAKR